MARLAAYYQEDFHYPSTGYGPKQRKSAYVLYEEPKNNLLVGRQANGNRIRSLAASEPTLVSDIAGPWNNDAMMLKQKPLVYGSQFIESPHSSLPYFEGVCDPQSSNRDYPRFETETFDNESMYSFCDTPYDDRYNPRFKPISRDRSRKRFSYAEPSNNMVHSPDMYEPQHIQRHPMQRPMQEDFCDHNNRHSRMARADNCYINQMENNLSPPVFYRSDPRQENFQQWPWAPAKAFAGNAYLSPPSPLDSGLSSQSITSSPSLEAEHGEPYPQAKSHRHQACLCPRTEYPENRCFSRFDSGRSSPGGYSISYPTNPVARPISRMTNHEKEAGYNNVNPSGSNGQQCGQVRYGKLGIVGEPTNVDQYLPHAMPPKRYDNIRKQGEPFKDRISYTYTDRNGVPLRTGKHKSHKPSSKSNKPGVIIETPEKGMRSERASSPEQENSEKSPGSESPMSVTMSNSDSPSVTSSNNDLDIDERRKSDKTTENEIRELEDMYNKCNLGDRDLLDRAERRDLPTAHQVKTERTSHRLARSNSDTLYEMISPAFHNPYETPQRAPPLRRAGMPDRIADDMALRKYHKPVIQSNFDPTENTITYMLCSSHFTPTLSAGKDFFMLDNPDLELDDLSYRKYYFGKKSKIRDPQPPFGIPLRPPPPQRVHSDYLHAVPSNVPQPLCHPRGNPDVVRDDMAFRTLRKDEPERIYYDIAQVYKKKKR